MKLLICSDGSEQAERAVRLGSAIAVGCQAEVTLLGVEETAGQSNAILESLRRGKAMLDDKRVRAELITKSGKPIEEIVRHTQERKYDLVVIGAVRKESSGLFWMSSKSYKIIKEIEPPVLIVAGKRTAVKRILLCSGGKHYIDKAVRLTGQVARGLGAPVTLIHVMPEPPPLYARLPRMEETAAWLLESNSELGIHLRNVKQELEALGLTVEFRLRQGSVLEKILEEVRQGDYDLVVTGSALSRSLRTYVLGDVSREIVNRVSRAILVVRSQSR